ncbi:MAG: SsrA-binding protein, partial [Victivallales bacterium]|nr:SsrA-binding protein [Victivallales bacterium]
EIMRLKKNVETKGLTLIPLAFYFGHRGKIKVELGLCRGKNTVDKREDLKKKMDDLEVRRALSKRQ